jgi:hypothetical protein
MSNGSQNIRESKKNPGEFDKPEQSLQKSEKDILEKIKFFEDRLRDLNSRTSDVRATQGTSREENVRLKDSGQESTKQKIEDLDKELADLEKALKATVKLTPGISPVSVDLGAGEDSTGQSMILAGSPPKLPKSLREIRHTTRTFIVARNETTVWVWNRAAQAWDAKLETRDKIIGMEQVDGTIAVYTKSTLWLFDPVEFRWIAELHAEIKEIKAFVLSVPAVQPRKK